MNILFITEDHSIRNYGITSVVSQLADQLTIQNEKIKLTILSIGCETVKQDPRVNIVLVPASNLGRFWGWSKNLTKTIRNLVEKEKFDIIHVHGIWMSVQWVAIRTARNYGISCVVSPHGMLIDWLWKNQNLRQKIKKIIYFNCIFKPALDPKVIFHAITPIELADINHQLPNQQKVIIPNAIEMVDEFPTQSNLKPEKQFLFLGRIAPIKAVDILIEAFFQAHLEKNWKLIIAGPEYVPNYVIRLKQKITNFGIEDRVIFTGSIYNKQKLEILQKSWALVLPSFSEVMGMTNLEAAGQKVPSITTYETGLWNWEEGGGLLVHPNVGELSEALKQAAAWTITERIDRGKRSYELVAENYSWKTVIPKWNSFYTELSMSQLSKEEE